MKKIISHIFTKRFLLIACLAAVCVCGLVAYGSYATLQFKNAYAVYKNAAEEQQNAAFTPGAATNPLRDELNQTLGRILAKETKPKDRLLLAQKGLGLTERLTKEVDVIHDKAAPLEGAVTALQLQAQGLGNVYNRKSMLAIVELARKQMDTIEDIRGLSYKANFEVSQICKHIISDNGVLTDAYTKELNDELPTVEKEFTARENAYADLQANMYKVEQLYSKITGV